MKKLLLFLFLFAPTIACAKYWEVTTTSGTSNVPFTFNSTDTFNSSIFISTGYIILSINSNGANLGEKILNGINALPSTGGVVDARGFTGAQTIHDFVSVTKKVTVLIGVSTITLTGTSGGNFFVIRGGNRFVGQGPGRTVFKLGTVSGTSSSAFSIEAGADDVEFSGFTLNGGSAGTAVQYGISTGGATDRIRIGDFRIEETSATIANVFITSGTYNTIDNFHVKAITNSLNHGVRLQNYSSMDNYHVVRNGVVEEGGFGFSTVLGGKIDWVNLWALGSNTACAEGFNMDSANKNTFTNIHTIGRGDGGFVETFNENVPGSSTGTFNKMNGGYFEGTYLEGMHITCTGCVYENILVKDTAQNDASNRPGIDFDNATSSTVLRNVTVIDDQANKTHYYPIQFESNSNNNSIVGGYLRGGENFGINDGGTNNKWTSVYDMDNGYFQTNGQSNFNSNVVLGDASGDSVTSNAATWTFANDTAVTLSGGVNGLNFDSNTLSIDATGNFVGFGTAAPGTRIANTGTNYTVNSLGVGTNAILWRPSEAGYGIILSQDSSASNAAGMAINVASAGGLTDPTQGAMLTLLSADTVRMIFQRNGNFALGVSSATAQFHSGGTVRMANFGAGAATFDADGNVSSVSDVRLKHVQGPFKRGLSDIIKINPISYKWNQESGFETSSVYHGFSAQNLKAAMPEIVFQGKNGYYSFEDRGVIAALVNSVKELSKRLERLESLIK